jgi:2-dehydrotetronate isomerase
VPRLAANISMMYAEHPFMERFAAAARDGFRAVEAQDVYGHSMQDLRAALDEHKLDCVLINAPAAGEERGFAALPGRQDDFRHSVGIALDYAAALKCPRVHVMSGRRLNGEDPDQCRDTLINNLREAAPWAAEAGVTLLIEPINQRDIPLYFLNYQSQAHDICREVAAANVRVQMDFYHCQIVEGDLATRLAASIAGIGHIQLAGVPERHEPDVGEINYPYLFELLDRLGYTGWVGCEYRPRAGTSAGLAWASPWLRP